jgi:hypothetical protein
MARQRQAKWNLKRARSSAAPFAACECRRLGWRQPAAASATIHRRDGLEPSPAEGAAPLPQTPLPSSDRSSAEPPQSRCACPRRCCDPRGGPAGQQGSRQAGRAQHLSVAQQGAGAGPPGPLSLGERSSAPADASAQCGSRQGRSTANTSCKRSHRPRQGRSSSCPSENAHRQLCRATLQPAQPQPRPATWPSCREAQF